MEGFDFEELKTQLEQWSRQALEYIHQIPPIQLYASLGVLLFTVLFLFFCTPFLCLSVHRLIRVCNGNGFVIRMIYWNLFFFFRLICVRGLNSQFGCSSTRSQTPLSSVGLAVVERLFFSTRWSINFAIIICNFWDLVWTSVEFLVIWAV